MTLSRTLIPGSFRYVLSIALITSQFQLFAVVDIGVSGIISPVSGCGLGEAYVVAQVTNYGGASVDGFPVCYQLDGGPVIMEVEALPLGPGDTMSEYFGVPIDLSVPGIYNLCVWTAAPDANPDNDMICITIESLATPDVELGADLSVCDPTILDAGNPGAIYEWDTGEITQTIEADVSGVYTVTVTFEETGCWDDDSIELTITLPPTAGFESTVDVLTYYLTNTSINSDNYTWDFGDGNTSDETDPSHTYAAPGVYNLSLSAFNECDVDVFSEAITLVAIEENGNYEFVIYPNPAQDVVSINMPDQSGKLLRVLDSQGKMVKEEFTNSVTHQIHVQDLQDGFYFIYLYSNEGMTSAGSFTVSR